MGLAEKILGTTLCLKKIYTAVWKSQQKERKFKKMNAKEIRQQFEDNGCTGWYDSELCYHTRPDCRLRYVNGKCSALVDTMFSTPYRKTYDCSFFKTEEQYKEECFKYKVKYFGIK